MSTYRMQHRAPGRRNGAPLSDLTRGEIYPCDVYSQMADYADGREKHDLESMAAIRAARCQPTKMVWIYRAVPKSVAADAKRAGAVPIYAGHWIAVSKTYAKQHAFDLEGSGKDGVVVSMKVPAGAVFTDGNSLNEWGYDP